MLCYKNIPNICSTLTPESHFFLYRTSRSKGNTILILFGQCGLYKVVPIKGGLLAIAQSAHDGAVVFLDVEVSRAVATPDRPSLAGAHLHIATFVTIGTARGYVGQYRRISIFMITRKKYNFMKDLFAVCILMLKGYTK